MNRVRRALALVIALGATFVAGCTTTQTGLPAEWDGLVQRPGSTLRNVWVKPDAEMVAYRNVMLDPVEVSFARNWDPNRGGRSNLGRLDASDMEAIKTNLADQFQQVFRAELEAGGYQIVIEPGPDTLRVSAVIIDLFITAPDTLTPGRNRVYTANSGRMTLVLEARDSMTEEILARAVDTRSGRGTGMMTITNRVTNTADAQRAIGVWARALREGLDDLYQRAGAAAVAGE